MPLVSLFRAHTRDETAVFGCAPRARAMEAMVTMSESECVGGSLSGAQYWSRCAVRRILPHRPHHPSPRSRWEGRNKGLSGKVPFQWLRLCQKIDRIKALKREENMARCLSSSRPRGMRMRMGFEPVCADRYRAPL